MGKLLVNENYWPVNAQATCNVACWVNKSSVDFDDSYITAYDTCNTSRTSTDPYGDVYYVDAAGQYSCPYNGIELLDNGYIVEGPIVEIILSDYLDFDPLKGFFDVFLVILLSQDQAANQSEVGIGYNVIVGGVMHGEETYQVQTVYEGSSALECGPTDADTSDSHLKCKALIIPADKLNRNSCYALSMFEQIRLQIVLQQAYSPLQSTLNTTDIGQGENTELIAGEPPYVTNIPFNSAEIQYTTTSDDFETVMMVVHCCMGIVMFLYTIVFTYRSYKFAESKFSNWYVERKWAVTQSGAAVLVAANPIYLYFLMEHTETSHAIHTSIILIDVLLTNLGLGVIFFFNLCFLSR
ncbi:hypothetical protein SARC_01449 [Sphaeroforma arctica JP610]|uniref:Uncharacterized protein n=1 Tax=Sphaeroforma arctica JP610 TaxID=667725 RepID=A0A0L0GBW4_9EUKA|nr:hypothetical protein SARC_01449 [Sphaeroforma arctica JP610]KNC86399.1 hypothetical protein SARC_01449 [Sphaeroforma arctica JP610]|eukprot:XP_014160301.1 hypothetical protein SARC_01449 [Sphaeroforma arctica JP610]